MILTIEILIDRLNKGILCIKLTTAFSNPYKTYPHDLDSFIELCLSAIGFLFNDQMRTLMKSSPIGLTIVVVISEVFLQRLESKDIL